MESTTLSTQPSPARVGPRFVYAALLALALLWLALIVAAPYFAHERRPLTALVIYRSFAAVCHQMAGRSFHAFGFPLAVCARCAGIYAGFFAGLCVYPLARGLGDTSFPPRRWLIVAALPALVDFAGGLSGLFVNTHASRSLTGAAVGAAAAFYVLPGLMEVRGRLAGAQPPPARPPC
jgi:uncharacterized membrane protein